MIKPTIGRVVWFHPSPSSDTPTSDQPNAAIITYVHSDIMVNLAIFDANGFAGRQTSVFLYQGEETERPASNYAEWMPYQLGQASKAEALENQLAAATQK